MPSFTINSIHFWVVNFTLKKNKSNFHTRKYIKTSVIKRRLTRLHNNFIKLVTADVRRDTDVDATK